MSDQPSWPADVPLDRSVFEAARARAGLTTRHAFEEAVGAPVRTFLERRPGSLLRLRLALALGVGEADLWPAAADAPRSVLR